MVRTSVRALEQPSTLQPYWLLVLLSAVKCLLSAIVFKWNWLQEAATLEREMEKDDSWTMCKQIAAAVVQVAVIGLACWTLVGDMHDGSGMDGRMDWAWHTDWSCPPIGKHWEVAVVWVTSPNFAASMSACGLIPDLFNPLFWKALCKGGLRTINGIAKMVYALMLCVMYFIPCLHTNLCLQRSYYVKYLTHLDEIHAKVPAAFYSAAAANLAGVVAIFLVTWLVLLAHPYQDTRFLAYEQVPASSDSQSLAEQTLRKMTTPAALRIQILFSVLMFMIMGTSSLSSITLTGIRMQARNESLVVAYNTTSTERTWNDYSTGVMTRSSSAIEHAKVAWAFV